MNVMITGNLGYLGPVVGSHLVKKYKLFGYDTGFFAPCLTDASYPCDRNYSIQYFGDIREINESHLRGVDAIVHLSAISNDPMGKMFERVTLDINFESSIRLAKIAKGVGVKKFTFASSCSVYGLAEGGDKFEDSKVNPLTAYAVSKVNTEVGLKSLADENFMVTCLRFSTACGWSPRLRLDLVLNDFVAGAMVNREIKILSDGTPWRPLIDVSDMARAIEWSLEREKWENSDYIITNVGAESWNFQVKDLALEVSKVLGGNLSISVNPDAPPDKRSYRADFSFFRSIAPNHQPLKKIDETIKGLVFGLNALKFADKNYHSSHLIRLRELTRLTESGCLNANLAWRS